MTATLGGPHLERCLDTLLAQTGVSFEVIVVDGSARDEVARLLRERYPSVRHVRLARNGGFAASNNAGIRVARGRWIATLNDDAYPEPGWLAALVTAGEADARVGACASKMVWADRPNTINSTGIALNLAGVVWDRRGGEPDNPAETEPVEIFGPCAGAALYRREALDAVGLFDPAFFAYLEDVDLAWRLRWGGWRTLYVPLARVLHEGSKTSDRFPRRKEWLLSRNRVYVLARNYDARALLTLWPLILGFDLRGVPWWRIRYQRDFTPLLGRLAGLAKLPRLLRRRARLPQPVVEFEFIKDVMEPHPLTGTRLPWAHRRERVRSG